MVHAFCARLLPGRCCAAGVYILIAVHYDNEPGWLGRGVYYRLLVALHICIGCILSLHNVVGHCGECRLESLLLWQRLALSEVSGWF